MGATLDRRLARSIEKAQDSPAISSLVDDAGGFPVTITHLKSPTNAELFRSPRAASDDVIGALRKVTEESFKPLMDYLTSRAVEFELLPLANSIKCRLTIPRIDDIQKQMSDLKVIRLLANDQALTLDDSCSLIAVPEGRHEIGLATEDFGKEVSVAIIDSGIDVSHPFLKHSINESTDNFSVHPEDAGKPPAAGHHGTHVAGIIASTHSAYTGVAPGVRLINIKAFSTAGIADHSFVVTAIEKAVQMKVDVINLSCGWSQIPKLGNNWECPDGDCDLCRAANVAMLAGCTVVVASGNERENANYIRRNYPNLQFATELTCPGNARMPITVGAVGKDLKAASISSRGPTSYGQPKPDLVAPGIGITSTIPGSSFGIDSGTSMATPHVAGLAAAIIQQLKKAGKPYTPLTVKSLLTRSTHNLGLAQLEQGAGLAYALDLMVDFKLGIG